MPRSCPSAARAVWCFRPCWRRPTAVHPEGLDEDADKDPGPFAASGSHGNRSTSSVLPQLSEPAPQLGNIRRKSSLMHPVVRDPEILACIRLIRTAHLQELTELPRCQEVRPDMFGTPAAQDLVVAVSHGWRNQTHPDPNGSKLRTVVEMLEGLASGSTQDALMFFDFLSIPQRPFRDGQQPRTDIEMKGFKDALGCMHRMYFLSDCIIHLDFFEDEVPGEEEVYTVQAHELRSAVIEQIGDWLQIVGVQDDDTQLPQPSSSLKRPKFMAWLARSQSSFQSQTERGWGLFDRVVDVEGEEPRSREHLHRLLSESPSNRVKCIRYPFGRINSIPADERGWVFLERFITSVKCAMLQPDDAERVVLTNSPAIKHQILSYAEMLRDAAEKDSRDGNDDNPALKKTMEFFIEELAKKRFSAASTDKLLIDAGSEVALSNSDAMVVQSIMQDFVEFLGQGRNWISEAACQQRRADRLTEHLAKYFLCWNYFSDDHLASINESSKFDPLSILALLVLPPLLALIVLLPPYELPTEPPTAQLVFWLLGCPVSTGVSCLMFPLFCGEIAGIRRTVAIQIRYIAWAVACVFLGTLPNLFISITFDVFPVPLNTSVAVSSVSLFGVPALWWTVPPTLRSDSDVRRRLFYSILAAMAVTFVFGTLFPLLNALLTRVDNTAWQMVILLTYLCSKLGFEKFGHYLYSRLGADSMPSFVFIGAMFYEFNLCVMLTSGFSWPPFLELLLFDAVENLFHLWSLLKQRRASADLVQQTMTMDGKQTFIISALLLREFVELTIIPIFLLEICMLRFVQPSGSNLVCLQSEAEFDSMIVYLIVDFGVECIVAGATWYVLVANGYQPVSLLCGLVRVHLKTFLAVACCAHMFLLIQQHSHFGVDLDFEFRWVQGANLTWQCGLQYIGAPSS